MTATYRSPVDIYETEHAYIIHAEVPGVDPSAIEVEIERDNLRIGGAIKQADDKQKAAGSWQRCFQLNKMVDREKIQAEMHDGVLKLTLPKPQEAKPKRISVSAA